MVSEVSTETPFCCDCINKLRQLHASLRSSRVRACVSAGKLKVFTDAWRSDYRSPLACKLLLAFL